MSKELRGLTKVVAVTVVSVAAAAGAGHYAPTPPPADCNQTVQVSHAQGL